MKNITRILEKISQDFINFHKSITIEKYHKNIRKNITRCYKFSQEYYDRKLYIKIFTVHSEYLFNYHKSRTTESPAWEPYNTLEILHQHIRRHISFEEHLLNIQ